MAMRGFSLLLLIFCGSCAVAAGRTSARDAGRVDAELERDGGPSGYLAGGFRGLIAQQREKCISTPAEFKRAFDDRDDRGGLRKVCYVGKKQTPSLVGQLYPGSSCTVDGYSSFGLAPPRPMTYLSGPDGLEKYLSFSPVLTIGDFTNGANFSDPAFPGINQIRNGQAFVNNIGFPPQFANINNVYRLIVLKVPPPRVTPTVRARVAALIAFAEFHVKKVTGQTVRVPQAARDILSDPENTFQKLFGCPAGCTWLDRAFPQPDPAVLDPPASIPEVVPDRPTDREFVDDSPFGPGNFGDCVNPANIADGGFGTDPTRYEQDAPSRLTSEACSNARWNEVNAFYGSFIGKAGVDAADPATCTIASDALTFQFADDLKAARGDAIAAALFTRAFIFQFFISDTNQQNTGTGFTAAQLNGLFNPTSSEFIAGPELLTWALESADRYTEMFFCINGRQAPDASGRCASIAECPEDGPTC